jgi:hypothetical protein
VPFVTLPHFPNWTALLNETCCRFDSWEVPGILDIVRPVLSFLSRELTEMLCTFRRPEMQRETTKGGMSSGSLPKVCADCGCPCCTCTRRVGLVLGARSP